MWVKTSSEPASHPAQENDRGPFRTEAWAGALRFFHHQRDRTDDEADALAAICPGRIAPEVPRASPCRRGCLTSEHTSGVINRNPRRRRG